MQPYSKSHLSLRDQLSHLQSKGLDCSPEAEGLIALHDYGYYRMAAYTYPFRRLLAPDEPRETDVQFRADDYLPGAKLSDASALASFDHGLRDKTFDGIAALELALRFQIAHVLGKRDKFGQTRRKSLDPRACSELPPMRARQDHSDMFDFWLGEYRNLIARASSEDFMQHVKAKYSGEVPIWIAVETFDFGGLARLYSLLDKHDQNVISSRFGVTNGSVFHKWLVGLAIVRNHCAHHNRLWNRKQSRALGTVNPAAVGQSLHHLAHVRQRNKLYVWAAVLAYALRNYDDTTNWHRTFATQAKKFPRISGLSLETDMGFPSGWASQDLWSTAPTSTRSLPTPVS